MTLSLLVQSSFALLLASPQHEWYRNDELAAERERGDGPLDDNLYAALFETTPETQKLSITV